MDIPEAPAVHGPDAERPVIVDYTGDVNLHVRLTGFPNERLALLFRGWFRAHPEAVPAYTAFKRELAAAVPHTATYSNVKDPSSTWSSPWPAPGPPPPAGSPSETDRQPRSC